MKRFILALIFILTPPTIVFAAGASVTETMVHYEKVEGIHESVSLTFACVGDDGTGAIADTVISFDLKGYYLYAVQTLYGATAPDDNTDLYILDENSLDVLSGTGVNRIDSAANNFFTPSPYPLINSTLTIDVDNQTAVDATYTIILYFVK